MLGRARERGWDAGTAAVVGLTGAAAVLRFATLGTQNFWPDEAVTAALVRQDLGGMLSTIPHSESTPPLYYLLAWGWARVFGTGEVGLRALSALVGTITVPVVYAAAAQLVSRRVAVYTALLAAVSPALVWYSQEARAYALLLLLSAVSLWLFARALRAPGRWTVALWAASCVAALLTHYFAIFLVAAEAAALVLLGPRRRAALIGTGVIAAAGACLLPLGLEQAAQGNAGWIADVPLRTRIGDTGGMFLAGETGRYVDYAIPALAALAVGAACLLLWPDRRDERDRALIAGALVVVAAAAPFALDAAGAHYVLARNLLPLWLPLALLAATGVVGTRIRAAGLILGAVLAASSAAVTIAIPMDRDLQRERITANLAGLAVDMDRSRLATSVDFADGAGRRPVRDTARCPGGYSTAAGDARWLPQDGARSPVRGHPLRRGQGPARGWTAAAPPPRGADAEMMVSVICIRHQ